MDTAQWPDQELVFKPMEEIVVTKPSNTCSSSSAAEAVGRNHEHGHVGAPDSYKNQPSAITEKKKAARPQVKDVNCPRCNSTNTKFCYYNNYSLTQPRYFCKTCKRYWTEGGTLRNIPVGGVSRKNKRSSSAAAAAAASKLNSTASNKMSKLPDLVVTTAHANFPNHPLYSLYQNPKDLLHYHEGQDLNFGFFSRSAPNLNHHDEFRGLCEFMHLPSTHTESTVAPNSTTSDVPPHNHSHNPNNPHHQHQLSALELITGLASSRGGGFASFMPMSIGDPNLAVYSSSEAGGFPLQRTDDHFKPTVNFSLEGLGGGGGGGYDGGNLQGGGMGDGGGNEQSHRSINGRLLFPFEDLKQPEHRATSATTTTNDQRSSDHRPEQQDNKEREATAGYWSGLLGGAAAGTGSWVNKSKEGSES